MLECLRNEHYDTSDHNSDLINASLTRREKDSPRGKCASVTILDDMPLTRLVLNIIHRRKCNRSIMRRYTS